MDGGLDLQPEAATNCEEKSLQDTSMCQDAAPFADNFQGGVGDSDDSDSEIRNFAWNPSRLSCFDFMSDAPMRQGGGNLASLLLLQKARFYSIRPTMRSYTIRD